MLRYHLDEHVSNAVARGLRLRQIDVTTTLDAGLKGGTDTQQLDYARHESRVIYTNDADFLRLASGGIEHAGIVYCHPIKSDVGEIVRFLTIMSDCLKPEDMQNVVEFM